MSKSNVITLKPIPTKDLPEEARIAMRAQHRAARKLRAEHRRLGLPLIVTRNGKIVEIEP